MDTHAEMTTRSFSYHDCYGDKMAYLTMKTSLSFIRLAFFVSLLYVSQTISSNQRLKMTILKLYGGRELTAMFIFVLLFFLETALIYQFQSSLTKTHKFEWTRNYFQLMFLLPSTLQFLISSLSCHQWSVRVLPVHSPQSLSTVYISYWMARTTKREISRAKNFRFPYAEQYVQRLRTNWKIRRLAFTFFCKILKRKDGNVQPRVFLVV